MHTRELGLLHAHSVCKKTNFFFGTKKTNINYKEKSLRHFELNYQSLNTKYNLKYEGFELDELIQNWIIH